MVNKQNDKRALIKGMEGAVEDIAFAHVPKKVVLGCMDQKGNLYIYEVVLHQELMQLSLVCNRLLHILPDNLYIPQEGDFFRVIWCPYIPDLPDDQESETEDRSGITAWQLAATRGNKVEVWNVQVVIDNHGYDPVSPGKVRNGYLEIKEHTQAIIAASFSPDGTAIATASLDGEVKFFQVYLQQQEKPRCLHHWKPHGGEPLSSLFFLDNHKTFHPDIQFWKFAITGAKNNSELKVWSCESWTCIQTLWFQDLIEKPIKLNACLDLAAGYLLLSDFHRKILYVLQLSTVKPDTKAAIISVSEFVLPYSILSFGIVDARIQLFKTDGLQELCNEETDEDSVVGVLVKMYLLQPKALQSCQVAFIPPKQNSFNESLLLPLEESPFYIPPDVSLPGDDKGLLSPIMNQQDLPSTHSSLQQLNLMTPDAFNSPVKHETLGSSLIKNHLDEHSYSNSTTLVASPHSVNETENGLLQSGVETSNVLVGYGFASGGSSPSREVQEILNEGNCFYEEADEIETQPIQDQVVLAQEKPVPPVWPEIPMLKMSDVRKNEEYVRTSVNQADSGGGDGESWKLSQRLETSISSMINVMNSLMQASEEQATEIKQLRDEVRQQTLLREIDQSITRTSQQQIILLDKILASKNNNLQEAALTSAVAQSVTNFLSTSFIETVNNEIKKSVVPAVMVQMQSTEKQLVFEFSKKLNSIDQLLKESIIDTLNTEAVVKVLSNAVVSTLKPVISQCYKDYFTSVIIPSMEKANSVLFSQIDDTFLKGTKEYVATIDTQAKHFSEKNKEQCAQIQSLSESLKNTTTEMNKDLKKSLASIEKNVLECVNRALTVQQAVLEGSVMAAVQSRSVTPAPHIIDMQTVQNQILQFIGKGDINGAFQQVSYNIIFIFFN